MFSALSFSRDGRWLAGGSGKTLKLWEVATGREAWAKQGHQEDITAVVFTADGRWLASGGLDNKIRIWEAGTGRELRTLNGHTSPVFGVSFSPDGRWLASASFDGSTRFWDPATGEQVAVLVQLSGDDWLAVTPQGLFDGSEEGMQKLVAWKIGNHTYPPDLFISDYYAPGLLGRIFAGERPQPDVDLSKLKLPPDVRITSPAAGATKQRRTNVGVAVADLGGGVAEVRLYQNGKLVNSQQGGVASGNYKFEVDLVPGENLLKVVALSTERVESIADLARVVLDAPQSNRPALHLLVVGINKYEDSSFNLGFARQDGEAIVHFFEQRSGKLFGSVDTLKLFDKEATQANIRKAFEQLAERTQPEDVALVYLAGHGVGLGQQFYFLPHEMRTEEDEQAAIRKYGIPALTLGAALRRVPALKQILILDTCQSAAALPIMAKLVGYRGSAQSEQKATKMLARSNGVFLLAASTKQQNAAEVPELGHGVLTFALLKGLGEKADPQAPVSSDGFVTMMALLQYVNEQVPELTEKYHGERQYPVSSSTGMDFPLVIH